jgi:hypothetical protein
MACRYAGIDWPSRKHEVLVAEETGEVLLSASYAHDEKGLSALSRMLIGMDAGLVAAERPDGLLVERLLDAGLRVLALHPNKVAAARDRFRVAGGKSDRFDASVLCELVRTDHHRFRAPDHPNSPTTRKDVDTGRLQRPPSRRPLLAVRALRDGGGRLGTRAWATWFVRRVWPRLPEPWVVGWRSRS